jgi:glycosyltransferase involved in cell wall biosynthesis
MTSEKELLDSDSHFPRLRRAVIPNGVDVISPDPSRLWMPEGKLRLLFLGRLHPIKGIEALLKAMALLEFPVDLSICGRGPKEYSNSLRLLCGALNLVERVHFRGEVLAEEKARAFRDADLCVIPSFAENFGMTVAESLASGVPVVVSRNTPWQRVEDVDCGYWVDNSPESLAAAITQMRQRSLSEQGERGRCWMAREFGWELIAAGMVREYEALIRADALLSTSDVSASGALLK